MKGKKGISGSAIGGVLAKDAQFKEFEKRGEEEKGAVLTMEIDFHTTNDQREIMSTTTVRLKIWGMGARVHNDTGLLKKNVYVVGLCGIPKAGKPFTYRGRDGTQKTGIETWFDLGNNPLHLCINGATVGSLSARSVSAEEVYHVVRTGENLKVIEEEDDGMDIPF